MKYQIGSATIKSEERIILLVQDIYYDLALLIQYFGKELHIDEKQIPSSLMQIFQEWDFWKQKMPKIVNQTPSNEGRIDPSVIQWLPPLQFPRKLICIGINYRDHIAEMGGNNQPQHPYSFLKPPSTTFVGSKGTIKLPKKANMIDWEAELAVVIGKKAHGVSGDEALTYVAGYTIFNDISARDWRSNRLGVGADWVLNKAYDGFGPIGPLITPAEFVPDPQNLKISLHVNDEMKQNSNTSNMIFGVKEIIEHLSSIMTLEPGDVIATGTPAGVGNGRNPPEFLRSGDYIVVEIEGLGRLENYIQ